MHTAYPWCVVVEYEDDQAVFGPFVSESAAEEWIDSLVPEAFNEAWKSRLWHPLDEKQKMLWTFENQLAGDCEKDNEGQYVLYTGIYAP